MLLCCRVSFYSECLEAHYSRPFGFTLEFVCLSVYISLDLILLSLHSTYFCRVCQRYNSRRLCMIRWKSLTWTEKQSVVSLI